MTELFLVGTFWFWVLVLAEIVLLFMFVNYENGIGALVSLVVFGCCLHFASDVNMIKLLMENPLLIGVVFGAYVVLSIPWGTFRWALFCRDKVELYEEKKGQFLRSHHIPNAKVVPPEHRDEWFEVVESTRDPYTKQTIADPPLARHHRGFITRAMALWPVDAVWWILGDMFVRFWKTIYNRIAGMLQHISDSMFRRTNIAEDLRRNKSDD